MNQIILLILFISFNALVFWKGPLRHGEFLFFLAVPVNIVYGFYLAADATMYSSTWFVGVMIGILGLYCLYRGAANIWGRD